MSRNYKLKSGYQKWVSAHRSNVFKFGIPTVTAFGGYDALGYLGLVLTSSYSIATPQVGDRLYIYSGAYKGFHTVRQVISGIQFITETAWTVSPTWNSEKVGFCKLPTVKVAKGYRQGELILPLYPSGSIDLYDVQPYEIVAEFMPEVGSDGLIEFDLLGYLKSVLVAPYKIFYNQDEQNYVYAKSQSEAYIPMNYQKVELIIENGIECVLYVSNSSITTNELNRYYVDTDQPMQPLNKTEYFTGKILNSEYKIKLNNQILIYG